MSYLQTRLISHKQRVCSLYKAAARMLEAYHPIRHVFRYHVRLLRQRFDDHKNEIDMIKAKKLVLAGEKELFENQHPLPIYFPNSPGGVAYEREVIPPDWILDSWHPLEKAMYPKYFALREKRKDEYLQRWEAKYGKPPPPEFIKS